MHENDRIIMITKELSERDAWVEVKKFNHRTGTTELLVYEHGLPQEIWTVDLEKEFFKRLKEKEISKKEHLDELVRELTHSFKPDIRTKKSKFACLIFMDICILHNVTFSL